MNPTRRVRQSRLCVPVAYAHHWPGVPALVVRHMNNSLTGIAVGGKRRLRKAVEAQTRAKYQTELAACGSEAQKAAVEEKIQREIAEELKRVASPYSLWNS